MTNEEFYQKTKEYLQMAKEHINKEGSCCSVVASVFVDGQTMTLVSGNNYGIQIGKEWIDKQLNE